MSRQGEGCFEGGGGRVFVDIPWQRHLNPVTDTSPPDTDYAIEMDLRFAYAVIHVLFALETDVILVCHYYICRYCKSRVTILHIEG